MKARAPWAASTAYMLTAIAAMAQPTTPKSLAGPRLSTVTLNPPSIAESFFPSDVPVGGSAILTLKIMNSNAVPLTGVNFKDTLPAGLVASAPGIFPVLCSGVFTATGESGGLTLAGADIAAGDVCTIDVKVTGTAPGVQANSVTVSDTFAGTGNTSTASIRVLAPPLLTKSFDTVTVGLNETTAMTYTFTNPNGMLPLLGVRLVDVLPPGLSIAARPRVVTNCESSVIIADAGTQFIILEAFTLLSAESCTVTLNVMGTSDGPLDSTSFPVTSSVAGAGLPASASIFVGDPFQVRYTANLGMGDSVVSFTNSGESSTVAEPVQNGDICVNVYAFSPDEQLISCCSCLTTTDGLKSISAVNDLTSNTLTPGRPTAIVVKLLATSARAVAPACNAATAGTSANPLMNGLAAWGTTIHSLPATAGTPATTFGITETRFVPATLSAAELTRVTALCGFIQIAGSGFGICKSCRPGGLGASKD